MRDFKMAIKERKKRLRRDDCIDDEAVEANAGSSSEEQESSSEECFGDNIEDTVQDERLCSQAKQFRDCQITKKKRVIIDDASDGV